MWQTDSLAAKKKRSMYQVQVSNISLHIMLMASYIRLGSNISLHMMLMASPPDRGGLTKGVERPPLLMDHQVKQRQMDEIHTIDSFLPF